VSHPARTVRKTSQPSTLIIGTQPAAYDRYMTASLFLTLREKMIVKLSKFGIFEAGIGLLEQQ